MNLQFIFDSSVLVTVVNVYCFIYRYCMFLVFIVSEDGAMQSKH